MVVSGEFCKKPSIHVWDVENLRCLSVFRGYHQFGVSLVEFSPDNKYIFSAGYRENCPIIVYDWRQNNIIFSTQVFNTIILAILNDR